jgi:acetylglutamate kinase
VIAGGTAGVLDAAGHTMRELDEREVERVIASGIASAGMVAKLGACRDAIAGGVDEVLLLDGNDRAVLGAVLAGEMPTGLRTTRLRLSVARGQTRD